MIKLILFQTNVLIKVDFYKIQINDENKHLCLNLIANQHKYIIYFNNTETYQYKDLKVKNRAEKIKI